MIHAGRKAKIKLIRESYIFTSAVKKTTKQKKNNQGTITSIDLHNRDSTSILNDLIQPHSEIASSLTFPYYEELTLTRN